VSYSTVTLEPEVADKLRVVTHPCWLRDDQGNVVGYFHPGKAAPRPAYKEGEVPALSEDEIQRRLNEPGGRTWEEIKRDLERLV